MRETFLQAQLAARTAKALLARPLARESGSTELSLRHLFG